MKGRMWGSKSSEMWDQIEKNHTFSLQIKFRGMYLSTHMLQYTNRATLSLSHREILHGMYQIHIVETTKNLFIEFVKTLSHLQNYLKLNIALSYCENLSEYFRSEPHTCVVDAHIFFRNLLNTLSPACLWNMLVCAFMAVVCNSLAP